MSYTHASSPCKPCMHHATSSLHMSVCVFCSVSYCEVPCHTLMQAMHHAARHHAQMFSLRLLGWAQGFLFFFAFSFFLSYPRSLAEHPRLCHSNLWLSPRGFPLPHKIFWHHACQSCTSPGQQLSTEELDNHNIGNLTLHNQIVMYIAANGSDKERERSCQTFEREHSLSACCTTC